MNELDEAFRFELVDSEPERAFPRRAEVAEVPVEAEYAEHVDREREESLLDFLGGHACVGCTREELRIVLHRCGEGLDLDDPARLVSHSSPPTAHRLTPTKLKARRGPLAPRRAMPSHEPYWAGFNTCLGAARGERP